MMAGPPRIGRFSSMNAPASLSSKAGYLGPRPKHVPSNAVSVNGSTVIQRHACQGGASDADAARDPAIHCSHLATIRAGMLGCIVPAGPGGVGRERSELSRHLFRWEFEQVISACTWRDGVVEIQDEELSQF